MRNWFSRIAVGSMFVGVLALSAHADGPISCTLEFKLSGWSAMYETASGSGTVKCSNGQKAEVTLSSKGGGMTFGKIDIAEGTGTFSEVAEISEVFGDYTYAEAEAGADKAAEARVLTKGYVSLALAGKGKGEELGLDFGKFTIKKK